MNFLTFRIQSLVGAMIIILFAGISIFTVFSFYQSTIEEIDNLNVNSSIVKIRSRPCADVDTAPLRPCR